MKDYIDALQKRFNFMPYVPILFVSAKLGFRCDTILPAAIAVNEARNMRITTSQLMNIVRDATSSHSPPARSRPPAQGLYGAADRVNPPTFVLHVNDPSWCISATSALLRTASAKSLAFSARRSACSFAAASRKTTSNAVIPRLRLRCATAPLGMTGLRSCAAGKSCPTRPAAPPRSRGRWSVCPSARSASRMMSYSLVIKHRARAGFEHPRRLAATARDRARPARSWCRPFCQMADCTPAHRRTLTPTAAPCIPAQNRGAGVGLRRARCDTIEIAAQDHAGPSAARSASNVPAPQVGSRKTWPGVGSVNSTMAAAADGRSEAGKCSVL